MITYFATIKQPYCTWQIWVVLRSIRGIQPLTALDYPDYLIIDIDPSDKNTFDDVIEAANVVKEILDVAGAIVFVKLQVQQVYIFIYPLVNNIRTIR